MNTTVVSEIQQNLQLVRIEDYYAILRRRKIALIIPFVLILVAGIS